jgi:cytochrome c oxidase cbb3-type subunit III
MSDRVRICAHRTLVALALAGLCSCGGPDSSTQATASTPSGIVASSHLAAGGNVPAGAAITNPKSGDANAAKAGAAMFTAMNCDGCHGGDASGWVGPSLADGRWRYGGSDAEIFSSIYYGRPKGMPAFGGTVGVEGAWTLVTYLKSLPVPADIATESWDDTP